MLWLEKKNTYQEKNDGRFSFPREKKGKSEKKRENHKKITRAARFSAYLIPKLQKYQILALSSLFASPTGLATLPK
jgi:hypothetical protein